MTGAEAEKKDNGQQPSPNFKRVIEESKANNSLLLQLICIITLVVSGYLLSFVDSSNIAHAVQGKPTLTGSRKICKIAPTRVRFTELTIVSCLPSG
jgi:hypothetical protein